MAVPPRILDQADLQNLCSLARLRLPASRQAELLQRLQAVIEAFAVLSAIDTNTVAGIEPVWAPPPLRQDAEPSALSQAQVLANAPAAIGGAFLVPRVIEG